MKFIANSVAALALTAILSPAALAETVIKVTLIDKMGSGSTDTVSLGMGMDADMSKAKMGITANPKTVRRGPVTIKVTNLASQMIHEVIVARVPEGTAKLPYDQNAQRADEDSLQNFGSVNEIDPNKTASLTLELKPGKYMLYCNLPGHYMAGMWTLIDVTE